MGLKNALTSLSFRARALRSTATSSIATPSGSPAHNFFNSSLRNRAPSSIGSQQQQQRQDVARWAVGGSNPRSGKPSGNSMLSVGGLLRSRSALDIRQVLLGEKFRDTDASSAAVDSSFNSRLAAFVEDQQAEVAPKSSVLARRIEVGLQELADLVEVSRKGWKMGYEGRKPFLIDVREPHELEVHPGIPGSINIPLSVLKASLSMAPDDFMDTFLMEKPGLKNSDVVFYGRGPNNSMTALEIAHKSGYKRSRHFPGGISAWEAYMNNFGVVELL